MRWAVLVLLVCGYGMVEACVGGGGSVPVPSTPEFRPDNGKNMNQTKKSKSILECMSGMLKACVGGGGSVPVPCDGMGDGHGPGCARPGPTPESRPDNGNNMSQTKKIWLFGIEGDWQPYAYIDENSGKAIGMIYDLIHEVCDMCGKMCDGVYLGSSGDRCFDASDLTAPGLNDGHFHACTAWGRTTQRKNVLNFTMPYMTARLAQVYVNPTAERDPWDSLRKMGFRKDYYMDKFCARRNGHSRLTEDMVHEMDGTWDDIKAALISDKIQMALMPEGHASSELLAFGEPFDCTDGGLAMMMRKDMDMSWWDTCLNRYKMYGSFEYLCQRYGSDRCLSQMDTKTELPTFATTPNWG